MTMLRLPHWLATGMVFQQGAPLKISGETDPYSVVTLEVVKDPTDGRHVSKLDTDYGVILSLETRTRDSGKFTFELPSYRASSDAYTLIIHASVVSVTIKDLRCGDLWLTMGSEPLCGPIRKTGSPRTPLKEAPMKLVRFFQPPVFSRNQNCLCDHNQLSSWIFVRDSQRLAGVSAAAFSMAYHLADQLHYPIGVIDLTAKDVPTYAWLSRNSVESSEAIGEVLKTANLYYSQDEYQAFCNQRDKSADKKDDDSDTAHIENKDTGHELVMHRDADCPLTVSEVKEGQIYEQESSDEPKDLRSISEEKTHVVSSTNTSAGMMILNELEHKVKPEEVILTKYPEFLNDVPDSQLLCGSYELFMCMLHDMNIRGIVLAPDAKDVVLRGKYSKIISLLLSDLSTVFGPRKIVDKQMVPSMILLAISPDKIDPEQPMSYLEFNEELSVIRRKTPMPIGILSNHDMLLPEKSANFRVGKRLASIALGLHFTPKMPTSCPECIGVEIVANKIMLTFDNTMDGLKLSENESVLHGFSICGEDRVYMPAKAKLLHGIRAMVWNESIKEPYGVMYAYMPVPHLANFKNRSGLPVLPFRFDREPCTYHPDLSFASCDRLEFTGKKFWDTPFEKLPVFQTVKGKCLLTLDTLNKTEGASSVKINYETENSLVAFGPVLSYASLFAPYDLKAYSRIKVDVFNPDQSEKTLQIEGFIGSESIEKSLKWQTLSLERKSEDSMVFEELTFEFFDMQKSGVLFVDNIRFE